MKKNLKRISGAALAACMALTMCACGSKETQTVSEAPAETVAETPETMADTEVSVETAQETGDMTVSQTEEDEDTDEIKFPSMGMSVVVPDALFECIGHTENVMAGDEMGYKSGFCVIEDIYYPLSPDEYEAALESEGGVEQYAILPVVLSIDNGRGASDAASLLDADAGELSEIGKNGDITYFIYEADKFTEGVEEFDEEHKEDFYKLHDSYLEAFGNAKFFEPSQQTYPSIAGTSFITDRDFVDQNDKPFDIAAYFAGHDITLVNLWGSYCGPCKEEMPDLEQLSKDLESKNCGVIGIQYDSEFSDEYLNDGKEVVKELGITYPILRNNDAFTDMYQISGIPVTIFVDNTGKVVGDVVEGAPGSNAYEAFSEIIDSLLNSDGSDAGDAGFVSSGIDEAVNLDDGVGVYRVNLKDTDGNPVKGAMVQFCSDTQCAMTQSDDQGVAEYSADPGNYHVHILKLPSGYAPIKDTIEMTEDNTSIDITVEKE
ncbi:MAG: TlpA family protein disulfide reductase [Lachnospiraceae bacterium]|nr:TlpA family protein disulfide reductase [Lachnospiraceae bacterium]